MLAGDFERGLLLLRDFGDVRFRETVDKDATRERELYELATDVLVHLHGHPPMPGLPAHGLEQWLDELACSPTGIARRSASRSTSTPIARPGPRCSSRSPSDGLGPVTVLRDYHAENIMLVEGREGVRHLGLLDFQDALVGPSGL